MIIDRQVGRTKPEERVYYLLYGKDGTRPSSAVEVLDGNAELFVELAKRNPYKTKTYNFLISFAESRKELEAKLKEKGTTIEELYRELLSFLFPAKYYPREALNIFAVAHSDTDNFHIHLTVENYDHLNQKSLYIPTNRTEIRFYRALEKYINAKYGLSFGVTKTRSLGRAGTEKIKRILEDKGTYKNKTRDEVKEEITNYLTELIIAGEIESREELLVYLQAIEGLEIKRIGKSYVSFEYAGQRYRLKGGIYDEQRFREIKQRIEGKGGNHEELAELLETLKRKREKNLERRNGPGRGAPLSRLELSDKRRDFSLSREVEELHFRAPELRRGEQACNLDNAFSFDWLAAVNGDSGVKKRGLLPSSTKLQGSSRRLRKKKPSLRIARWDPLFCGWGMEELSKRSYSNERLKKMEKVRDSLMAARKQEVELLKELDPEEVLSALGIEYKKMNGYLLMHSPVREGDEHPSFTVFYGTNTGYWIYKDHATGWKGSSIDLWKAVRGVDYITAVKEMREKFGIDLYRSSPDFGRSRISELLLTLRKQQEEKRRELNTDKEFTEKIAFRVLEISNKIKSKKLRDYLVSRGIKRIPNWLKQVRYQHLATGKVYEGLAVENTSGALNVRTPQGKYVILREPTQFQTYSLVKRALGNKKLLIVEGLFDALSIEQVVPKGDYDILILNSVNNVHRVIQDGVLEGYERLVMALDNDPEGSGTMESLIEALRGRYELVRLFYKGKDLNEWLVKYRSSQPKVEVISKPYYAGIFKVGKTYNVYGDRVNTYELVITDDFQVLERLSQEKELCKVMRISSSEILTIWREWIFEGAPRIITRNGRAPEWIIEALKKAKREERRYAPHLPGMIEVVEIFPPEPKVEKYWLVDGEVIFKEDIEKAPEFYLQSEVGEVKQIAKRVKEREQERERKKLEVRKKRDRDEDDYGPSLGI